MVYVVVKVLHAPLVISRAVHVMVFPLQHQQLSVRILSVIRIVMAIGVPARVERVARRILQIVELQLVQVAGAAFQPSP